ncbi:MAG: ATP-binding protein, partial [Cyanobacteriota bacterium]|nr:ATP-binding protein [Cyanobacteriota bacterium]
MHECNHFESSGATLFLSSPQDRQPPRDPLIPSGTPATNPSPSLDFDWLLTASQRLCQELELNPLLTALIEIFLDTPVVSSAWFIVKKSSQWSIVAHGDVKSNSVELLADLPFNCAKNSQLISIVNHVLRTQTPLALNQMGSERNLTLSILSLPIKLNEELRGVLYLENHLKPDAFTSEVQDIFNRLCPQIAIALHNAERYDNLNQKLVEQTQAQERRLYEFKQAQEKLSQSEKLADIGQKVTEIAHEINTPLGAVDASIQNLAHALDYTLEHLPSLFRKLSPSQQDDFIILLAATHPPKTTRSFREERQLKRTLENQLIDQKIEQAETLASMLVEIGIIEINPSILNLLHASNVTEILETAYHLALQSRNRENIKIATDKALKIVATLQRYVHLKHCDCMTTTQVSEDIDATLDLYQHQLKPGIKIKTDYQDLPQIQCYPDQLNQVWTNLIQNAIQAMKSQGELEIVGNRCHHFIRIQITDSGCGIPAEIKENIFEPFFTTKAIGEGTGLGLDIVRKIVEQHQGHIEVESQPGRT